MSGEMCPICGKAPAVTFQVEVLATVPLACATCHPMPRTSRETDAGPLSPEAEQIMLEGFSRITTDEEPKWGGAVVDVESHPIAARPRKRRGRRKPIVTLSQLSDLGRIRGKLDP